MSKKAGKIAVLLLVLAALSLPAPGRAEPLKVSNPGTGSVPLQGNWQFHLGDDKAWADPTLDDSGWEPIRIDHTWGQQSHPSYTGFAWYRRRIEIDNSNIRGNKEPGAADSARPGCLRNLLEWAEAGNLWRRASPCRVVDLGHPTVYPLPGTSGVVGVARMESATFVGRSGRGGAALQNHRCWAMAPCLATWRRQSAAYGNDERRLPSS